MRHFAIVVALLIVSGCVPGQRPQPATATTVPAPRVMTHADSVVTHADSLKTIIQRLTKTSASLDSFVNKFKAIQRKPD
jgi:hypothetical protein